MERTDIINALIKRYGYKTYLEIGIGDGENFRKINCESKESVDPFMESVYDRANSKKEDEEIIANILTYRMTSDEMFERMSKDKKYDIVFIDGLHLEEQVGRDVINSLRHLSKGGCIVVHDCLPEEKEWQNEERTTITWCGSVWKALPSLSEQGIKFAVVDCNLGCGILQYDGDPELLHYPEKTNLEYDDVFLDMETRNKTLNVITPDEFIRIISESGDGGIFSVC